MPDEDEDFDLIVSFEIFIDPQPWQDSNVNLSISHLKKLSSLSLTNEEVKNVSGLPSRMLALPSSKILLLPLIIPLDVKSKSS